MAGRRPTPRCVAIDSRFKDVLHLPPIMRSSRRASEKKTRSRRIVLSMLCFFALAQVMAGLLFDHVWPEVRFPFLYRQIAKVEASTPPTLVCLGSSRFGTSLLEEDMNRVLREAYAFNAAVPAGDPLSSEYVLDQLLAHGIRPRTVVIEILPEALNHRICWMKSHVERQLGWEDLPTHFSEIVRTEQLSAYCQGRLFPLYAYRRGVFTFVSDKVRQAVRKDQAATWKRALGDIPTLSPQEKQRLTREGLERVTDNLADYDPNGLATDALVRILTRCRAERIEPILVIAPVSSMHRKLYTPEIEYAFQQKVQEICSRFSCACLDCREVIPDEEFYDNHHASRAGGKLFSEWLMQRLLN